MIQRSRNKGNRASNRNEEYIVDDIRELLSIVSNLSPDYAGSVYMNGFSVVGCIGSDIVLPANTNLQYNSPLSICSEYNLTVSNGTSLIIV